MRNTPKLLSLSVLTVFICALCMGCPPTSHEDEHGGNGPAGDDDDATAGDDDDAVGDDDDAVGDDDDAVGDDDDAMGDDDDNAAALEMFIGDAAYAACSNGFENECLDAGMLEALGWADMNDCIDALEMVLTALGATCTFSGASAGDCVDQLENADCQELRSLFLQQQLTGACSQTLSC